MAQGEGPAKPLSLSATLDSAYSSALSARTAFISFSAITLVLHGMMVLSLFEYFRGTHGRFLTVSVSVLSVFFQAWLWIGLLKVSLDTMRGHPIRLSDLVAPPGLVFRCLVIAAALFIPVVIGSFLLVVPGLYLAAMWSMIPFALMEGRARFFDSVSVSEKLTEWHRWKIALVIGGFTLLNVIGDHMMRKALRHLVSEATARGYESLLISSCWHALVLGFSAFVYAALYQQLLERQPIEVGEGPTVSSSPPALDSKDG